MMVKRIIFLICILAASPVQSAVSLLNSAVEDESKSKSFAQTNKSLDSKLLNESDPV